MPPAMIAMRLPAARRVGKVAGQKQAQVLLPREDRLRVLVGIGRDHDLGEDLR